MSLNQTSLANEFNSQIQNLLNKDYPKAAGFTPEQFIKLLDSLKKKTLSLKVSEPEFEKGYLPFVIVIKNSLIIPEIMVSKIDWQGKTGVTKMIPHQITDFATIQNADIPNSPAYIISDIDRGKETLNVRPNEALNIIKKQNRLPLTIEEGIAIVTQYPDFLIKNNCFSLLASRIPGSQSVPAIWINSSKQPNLGWCWDGNPHTWLGSASSKQRIG